MKIASNVFWCSFLVNQRGCPNHLLTPLFDYLVENDAFINNLKANEKKSYERNFVNIHGALLDAFVEAIDGLCDE